MASTLQITGSKDEIIEQIRAVNGHILSAILVVEVPTSAPAHITDEEPWAIRMLMIPARPYIPGCPANDSARYAGASCGDGESLKAD